MHALSLRLPGVARVACLAAALVAAAVAPGAEIQATSGGAAAPWTSLAANDAEQDFHFVIVADRTGGERPGVFESALPKVNLLEPAFVLSVGDLIEGYTEDQAQVDREWDEFERFVASLEAPFFYVAGNHDMNNAMMAETWQARFGPSFYRFVYKDVLFLVLNSELFGMVGDPDTPVPGPWTQAEQLAFIAESLREYPDPRWTIVVVHQPLWDYAQGVRGEWPQVEAMLGDRDYTVFAGHFHRYVLNVRNDRQYVTLATTGGGSSLRGLPYGEFDHVAWVTMTDAGPRIANLMLDGIHDVDAVTAAQRAAVRTLSSAVRSVALLGEGEVFEQGAAAFEVANRGGTEMRVAYNVDGGQHLRAAERPEARAIAPGETARVEIPLLAAHPVGYGALLAGRVEWTVSTGGVSLKTASALLPVAALPLPTGPAPKLDGGLDDWAALPFEVRGQGDVLAPNTRETDISYAFGLRESGGDIYFAAAVVDDSIVASESLGPRVQDAVLINVDSRPAPARSANVPLYPATRDGHVASMARRHLTLVDALPDPPDDFLPQSAADVRWRAARTDTGYIVEARVPGDFLDAQAGGPWQTVRIAVAAVDWDEGEIDNRIVWETKGSSGVGLHWQPDRFGEAPVAASGTFYRTGR